MLRAIEVLPAGGWNESEAIDRVVLDHDERHRRRFRYTGVGGTTFLLDLPTAVVLADGEGLRLEDGRIVAVGAAAEKLMEVTGHDAGALMRIAWHIGNRHLPAQLGAKAIRLRYDHVIEAMLIGLGGHVHVIEAPFTPEQGAYAGGGQGHGHAHSHDHDHGHSHDH